MRRILVADDSPTIQKVIKIAFARYPIELIQTNSVVSTLGALASGAPDIMLIDAGLPGSKGPADLVALRQEAKGAPVLLLAGTYETIDEEALNAVGLSHILKKPFESQDIVRAVEQLLGAKLDQGATAAQPPAASAVKTPSRALHSPPPSAISGSRASLSAPVPTRPTAIPQVSQHTHVSGERPEHATVVHPGGLPGLAELYKPSYDQEDEDGSPFHSSPSRPLSHAGSKAVDQPSSEPLSQYQGRSYPEATQAGSSSQTLPPPPPQTFSGRRSAVFPNAAPREESATPSFELDEGRKGRKAYGQDDPQVGLPRFGSENTGISLHLDEQQESPGLSAESRSASLASSASFGTGSKLSSSLSPFDTALNEEQELASFKAQLKADLQAALPAMVRQAVEEYCERNFKVLAKEVITTELRRLAEEKARHLVDN